MIKARVMRSYMFLPVLLLVFIGCSNSLPNNTIPQQNAEEIVELKKAFVEQRELLENLQALTADLMVLSSELEQTIPPRDLLQSLQSDIVELRKKTTALQKSASKTLNKGKRLKASKAVEVEFPKNQRQLLLGLISLQAGNPDQAVEDFKEIIKQKKPTQFKAQILLAVAHSFLAQGYAKQAASHYGTFLREYPKSRHIPQALYYLGEAMRKLGEKKKQKVLWKELINKFPKSSFANRAKK
ncbi:MAG: tetratricopeptide repeat protein [SAR324 cluster bacterium]|nr:tetratricopeptide repeat protein [SAR324 cluster bacterium]